MSQKKITLEERFLAELFQAGGDVPIEVLQKTLALSDRQCRHVIDLLAHGNFLKKQAPASVCITSHGVQFVQQNG